MQRCSYSVITFFFISLDLYSSSLFACVLLLVHSFYSFFFCYQHHTASAQQLTTPSLKHGFTWINQKHFQVVFGSGACIMNFIRPHERHPLHFQTCTHVFITQFFFLSIVCAYVCLLRRGCTVCKNIFSGSQSKLMPPIWDVNSVASV